MLFGLAFNVFSTETTDVSHIKFTRGLHLVQVNKYLLLLRASVALRNFQIIASGNLD